MSQRWSIVAGIVVLVVALAVIGRSPAPAGTVATAPVLTDGDPTDITIEPSAGKTLQPNPTGGTSLASRPAPGTLEPLAALVASLRIEPEHRAGYERDLFVHWIDADGDGCNTRKEVLIAEAVVAPTVGSGCFLTGGEWVSLYDGEVFTDIADLQIDHVVALAEAWDSGAYAWTHDRRMAFANDLEGPFELVAVSGATNEAKADSDPADWLPPLASAECPFLERYIASKARWNLSIDQREHDALVREIDDCSGAEMPYDPFDG